MKKQIGERVYSVVEKLDGTVETFQNEFGFGLGIRRWMNPPGPVVGVVSPRALRGTGPVFVLVGFCLGVGPPFWA